MAASDWLLNCVVFFFLAQFFCRLTCCGVAGEGASLYMTQEFGLATLAHIPEGPEPDEAALQHSG